VGDNLKLGIVLAVIVLFVFLRRIGTTLIVSISMPVSINATFNLMYFNGLTLNIMTLGGLALGAGNVGRQCHCGDGEYFQNRENGMPVKEAAIVGTSEVCGAIVASTITTIVVFLPIVYLHGASGELFKDQAWVVTFSLVSSLVVAILLIPMLYNVFIKTARLLPTKISSGKRIWPFSGTRASVQKGNHPGCAGLARNRGCPVSTHRDRVMPKSETREFSMDVKLQEGTRLERTASTVANLESIITELLGDNLQTIYSQSGRQPG
jgi:HAE1 family hydrophobic/amphiphilic exporter-1